MRTISGREADLRALLQRLAEARRKRSLQAVRLVGAPGSGKTALLEAFLESARAPDSVVFGADCHLIDQERPLALARATLRALLAALGPDRLRYLSGLEQQAAAADPAIAVMLGVAPASHTIAPAQFEMTFARLVEGVSLDNALILYVDDCHWIDAESARVLECVLEVASQAPVMFVTAQRTFERAPFARLQQADIFIGPLRDDAARAIVHQVFPEANAAVAGAIVQHAGGNALDLVTLSAKAADDKAGTADGVLSGVRDVVATRVATASADLRYFLQLCSILGEPIDLRLLSKILGSGNALPALVAKASPRYLVQIDSSLRFVHALVSEAVRTTIPATLPLEQRVLQALVRIEDPSLSEVERIVDFARRCGETDLEYEYLVRLGNAAFRSLAWDVASNAYGRALEIRRPPLDGYVSFFQRYAVALQGCDSDERAEHVLRGAASEGAGLGVRDGLGKLAALLVRSVWDLQKPKLTTEAYRFYAAELRSPSDRAELLGTAALLASDALDDAEFERVRAEFAEVEDAASTNVKGRFRHAESLLLARLGDSARAREAWAAAATYAMAEHSLLEYRLPIADLLIALHERGCGPVAERLPDVIRSMKLGSGNFAFAEYFATLPHLAAGDWDAALTRMEQANPARLGTVQRARMLCIPALIAAFTQKTTPYETEISDMMRRLVSNGMQRSAVELAPWWLAATGNGPGQNALAAPVARWVRQPPSVSALSALPIAVALWAERCKETTLLEWLAEDSTQRRSPWISAHSALARAYAMRALRQPTFSEVARGAAQALEALQAPFFAAFAAWIAGNATAPQLALLARLDVAGLPPAATRTKKSRGRDELTPREYEVAQLISAGRTNREIAQALFLSERTVEVHVGNALGKVGITSRTQLARWILDSERTG